MIAAIVLAAGAARRFGSQKLVAPLAGKPLVRWAVEHVLASCVDDVVVVLGHEEEAVRRVLGGLAVRFVVNDRWAQGMSTSLRAGVEALRPGTRAALVVLGDQPSVAPDVPNRLIAAHGAHGRPIVAPRYRGERGHPVLFAAELFAELQALGGDRGARALLERSPERVELVDVDAPLPGDVDTTEELARTRPV